MADSKHLFDTWVFELEAGAESESEFALRVALFCVGLTNRSMSLVDKSPQPGASMLLH